MKLAVLISAQMLQLVVLVVLLMVVVELLVGHE